MHPLEAMENLFFTLVVQSKSYNLVKTNEKGLLPFRPDWTISLFKIIFAVYMLITSLVVLKILTAAMSDTYKQFQAQADTEWKYNLSKLIRNIHLTTTAPSPINLITTWLCYLIDICRLKVKRMRLHHVSPRSRAGNRWVKRLKKEEEKSPERASVASSLVMRSNSSYELPINYKIRSKYIEYVTNWPRIVREYRTLKKHEEIDRIRGLNMNKRRKKR